VVFVGVDLAWTPSGGTGLCLIRDGRAVESTRVSSDHEILAWLEPRVVGDALVAIDAPLIVRNLTGRRPCDQLISHCFGASTHSANLGLDSFRNGVRGERIAAALRLNPDPVSSRAQRCGARSRSTRTRPSRRCSGCR
jgi:predicted RNase H-like nuclease